MQYIRQSKHDEEFVMNSNCSRRDFAKFVALSAALGTLLDSQKAMSRSYEYDTHLSTRKELSTAREKIIGLNVAIIGSGVAGLVAAYELAMAGAMPVVFEARDKIGGRVETVRSGDYINEDDISVQVCDFDEHRSLFFNTGAARISQEHALIMHYCRELNVPMELVCNENKAAYYFDEAISNNNAFRIRTLQSSIRGWISELAAKSVVGSGDKYMSSADSSALLELISDFGDLNQDLRFVSTPRGGVYFDWSTGQTTGNFESIPISEIVKLESFSRYKLNLGEFLNQQASMMHPIGGMDKFIQAFYQKISSRVFVQTEVVSVKRYDGRCVVRVKDASGRFFLKKFDAVIVTTPPVIINGLDIDISEGLKSELVSKTMSKPSKVAFQSPRFWETRDGIYGGVSYTSDEITMLWYPSNDLGSEQGIIVGAYHLGVFPGELFSSLSVNERVSRAITQGGKIHQGYESFVKKGITRSWERTNFIKGGWALVGSSFESTRRADGSIFFAGDHMSSMPGWMEGSALSAHLAVRELLKVL
ncbi:MAG: FAD-dependent oxidoreductase [Lautropia sp.]|nr:FAD-dependent oxidoreductase [Lautropia sp.]